MKTFLKLTVALFAFGFATANAAFTPEQKAAAIKAVTDAVESGDESKVKEAVSQQVASFPELAGDIVSAALKVSGITDALRTVVVKTAAFTAPGEKSSIIAAINGTSGLSDTTRSNLVTTAEDAANEKQQLLDRSKKGNGNPTPAS